ERLDTRLRRAQLRVGPERADQLRSPGVELPGCGVIGVVQVKPYDAIAEDEADAVNLALRITVRGDGGVEVGPRRRVSAASVLTGLRVDVDLGPLAVPSLPPPTDPATYRLERRGYPRGVDRQRGGLRRGEGDVFFAAALVLAGRVYYHGDVPRCRFLFVG